MDLTCYLQIATTATSIPSNQEIQRWAEHAVADWPGNMAEATIRLVDIKEMIHYNQSFRNRMGSTNVLSFPDDDPSETKIRYLGDIAICAPIVLQEAHQQKKLPIAHFAHLTIHGMLHLIGYDHQKPKEASIMENLEIQLLQHFQFDNPYAQRD